MKIIGHRGVQSHAFENTIESIKKGVEMKLDMIEIDIQMTKDNVIVVSHDNFLYRLLKQSLFIDEITYEELQKYNLQNGEKIPKLNEIIELINTDIVLNIEIKPNNEKICKELKKIIDLFLLKGWKPNNFLISSFNLKILQELNNLNLFNINLGLIQGNLLDNDDYYYTFLKKNNISVIIIDYIFLDDKEIQNKLLTYKKNKIEIFTFTVNYPEIIKKIPNLENLLDGIITDNPDRFL